MRKLIFGYNEGGELHLLFTEKEKPCEEAYIKELLDSDGNKCSRYFIDTSVYDG